VQECSEMREQPKVQEHPKVQEQLKVDKQPKVASVVAGTPLKGKRMVNVLKAVLRPTKMASISVSCISL
jgi:hypothetical protein